MACRTDRQVQKYRVSMVEEAERYYENTQRWNLDAEYMEPLKMFLVNNISE